MTKRSSKLLENTEGKGEIACHEQFLLLSQSFQNTKLQTRENQGLFGKGLNTIPNKCVRENSL